MNLVGIPKTEIPKFAPKSRYSEIPNTEPFTHRRPKWGLAKSGQIIACVVVWGLAKPGQIIACVVVWRLAKSGQIIACVVVWRLAKSVTVGKADLFS